MINKYIGNNQYKFPNKILQQQNNVDKSVFVQQNTSMEKHILDFLHQSIKRYKVSVSYDDVSVEYSIELDSGSFLFFECRYATDDRNRPARYYAASLDGKTISESHCLNSCKKPTAQTRQLMCLLQKCSDKVLKQEMQARQNGILNQIAPKKTYS